MSMRSSPAGDFDYELHGESYSVFRQTDPRIATAVAEALGDAPTVLNVGAGAGSYEPLDRYVCAVEPSAAMRAQRSVERPPAVDATAERLPFDADSFDAAMATVTVHQWADLAMGLRELRRVSRGRVVILTFDGDSLPALWLNNYVPEVIATERRRFPALERIIQGLGGKASVLEVPIPRDCTDGFKEAYYARPEAFLRPEVRAAQSAWGLTDQAAVERGVAHLREALARGTWDERHGHLRTQPEYVGSLRLIIAEP